MHEGKDKKQLEEVYRLQAEAEQRGRLSAAEAERAGERSNPMPQKAPGAGRNARPGGAEADNPVLLDVAGDQFSTNADKVALIMVGLPARGKTHVSRRLARYLNFFHSISVKVFNVGDYRRKLVKDEMPASFFDHGNEVHIPSALGTSSVVSQKCALACLVCSSTRSAHHCPT
mmetsp:Transcript_106377/g.308285  ORF Transcript_106377/g.308285 Transcript_106377/m.308285 type:complete len:173 (+) Transcript_106377:421-939(+)